MKPRLLFPLDSRPGRVATAMVLLLSTAVACVLPSTAAPTPFVFPTANLTLTALFEPSTEAESSASGTPLLAPSAAITDAATADPNATGSPASASATPAARPTVLANRMTQAPTIDGALEEWDGVSNPMTEVVYGRNLWSGGADLSATFQVGWDSTYLYLAISVTDDSFVQLSNGRELFKGDSAELLLDSELAADLSQSTLSGDDYQLGISPGDFDDLAPEVYRWFPLSVEGALTSAEAAASETDGGYQIEARIPWSAFGATANVGAEFGFAVSVSDNDQAGTAAQQTMVSSAPGRILTDPTSWGRLQLADG